MGIFRLYAICVLVFSNSLPRTYGLIPDGISQLTSFEDLEMLTNTIMSLTKIPFSVKDMLQLPKDISDVCMNDIKFTLAELTAAKTWSNASNSWAVRMLDSIGKPPSGILSGNLYWLGSFQQCLEIVAIDSSREKFIGEYCIVKVQFNKLQLQVKEFPMDVHIGLCFPSTCSHKDKSLLLDNTFGLLRDSMNVSMMKEFCQTKHGKSMDTTTIALICVISAIGLLVAFATLADMLSSMGSKTAENFNQSSIGRKVFAPFSAIKNLKIIFRIDKNNSELYAINGLRVFSSYWILVGHSMSYTVSPYPWKNQLHSLRVFESFFLQPLTFNSSYAVTTFFTISGFLVTYIFMKKSEARHQALNIFWFNLSRYLRLTLPVIIMLMFLSGPCYHINDGPMMPYLYETFVPSCRNHWWKSILYIQNILIGEHDCLFEGWYLSADTQLHFFAYAILYLLFKKPSLGLLLMGTIVGASSLYTSFIITVNNYPTFLGRNTDVDLFKRFYGHVYNGFIYHSPCYVIGMSTGYLYFVFRKHRISLDKRLVTPFWISATTMMLGIVYGPFPYHTGPNVMGPGLNLVYGVLGRPAWSLGVAWIIFACAIGHGGLFNWFLSRPIFTVIGRLTFTVYLTHNSVLAYYFMGQHDGLYFSTFNVIMSTISNYALSLMAALFLALLIDTPTTNILKQSEDTQTTAQPIKKLD